ncbi:MAG TPA: (Fe-S)-binding protein, partial [Haliangiales bacterium]|nr:(Fe-S)-binding protein [Haliangiales bacterium]
ALQLEYCTFCPKMCRHACPVSTTTGHETYIPQNKMEVLNLARKGQAPWSREHLEPIWACTGCRQCTDYCAHGNEPGTVLFAGRAEAQRRGAGHPALDKYPERFRAREDRLRKQALAALPRERFAEEAQVVVWPGCDSIDKGEADVRAQLAVIDRVGAEHVRIAAMDRMCGGYPLLAAGHPDVFRWHAARVADELARYRTVVMTCSACVHTLRALYPAEGIHIAAEILHVTEYLAPEIERLRAPAERRPVYYHDPCYLARYADVIEPPRKLLGRVAEVRELAWSRRDTECCGGAGVLPKTMPQVADDMARRRLAEVARAGGGTVATSCGTCKHMLARNAPAGVAVRDVVELVEERTRVTAPAATPDTPS